MRRVVRYWKATLSAGVILFFAGAALAVQHQERIVAGSGSTVTGPVDNADGTHTWTVSASGAVSSVTGAGSTSCSPTTGAVTCTTTNSVSNGLTGDTTGTAHALAVWEGTSPIAAVTCANSL